MQEQPIRTEHIERFARQMRQEERSPGTVEKYLRDVRALERWLNGRPVTRESVAAWRDRLLERGLAPSTVNSMLSAANSFLRCLGREDCLVKLLRVQRRTFREQGRELTREDYRRLVSAARSLGRSRLALLLETICSTGIRVSEVRCFTVESVARGRAEVRLKGKSAPSSSPPAWDGSWPSMPESTASPPAKSSSPEAERAFPAARSGGR